MNQPSNKDFDALVAAMESGNPDDLDKLMQAEENDKGEEDSTEEDNSVDDSEATDTNEDEDSPSEVNDEDGSEQEDQEEVAASTAATPVKSEREIELEKELHRYKSDAGRLPFVQRRLTELERELARVKARDSQVNNGTGGKPTVKTDSIQLDEETQREIDELREIDPVMAKTLERVAKAALAASKSNVDHAVDTLTEREREAEEHRFLMEQNEILISEIPQAHQIFATPEWRQWKETLTPGQRALAESSYASEVKQAIYAFAAAMQPVTQTTSAPAAQAAPVLSDADLKVKQARERKVSASAEVKSPSGKVNKELDADAYFKEMYEKIGKESHILK